MNIGHRDPEKHLKKDPEPETVAPESADEDFVTDGEDTAWRRFLHPAESADFLSGWLEIAVGRIDGAVSGLLFLRGEGENFGIAATYKVDKDLNKPIQSFVEKLADKPQAMVEVMADGKRALAGYPVESGGELQAMLVVALARYHPAELRNILREMHWVTGWIDAQLWRGRSSLRNRQVAAARLSLDLIAAVDEHDRFDGAALSVINALPELTGFERAAIGMIRRGRVRLEALSRTASFERRSDAVSDFEAAMDEAVAQDDVVVFPARGGRTARIDLAHRQLASRLGSGAVLTAPLIVRGQPVGALLLERGRANDEVVSVDQEAIEEIRLAAAAVSPLLKLKHDERRWVSGRARNLAGRGITAIFGRRPAIALSAVAVALFVAAALLIRMPLRISGHATLEGREQRAAVSLLDGYIRESNVRAGDRVRAGDLLVQLDDRELQLELDRSRASVSQAQQAARSAMSGGDRAAAAQASAELAEARAALELTQTRLKRLDIIAPMDGIVVSGDLTQKLGAPVKSGDVLFEIAQLDDYRVRIDVSEYDLAPVRPGQGGKLVLNAIPESPIGIEIVTISSVSEPANSENRFGVEARVSSVPEQARPGMEGIVKIETGEASLAWIWLRSTVRRLELFFWRWMP